MYIGLIPEILAGIAYSILVIVAVVIPGMYPDACRNIRKK